MARTKSWLRRELLLFVALISCGLLPLPVLVYWIGIRVVGEYSAESGLWGLISYLWSDLAAGNVLAWILVISPYLIIQLLRLGRALWRYKRGVSDVTVLDRNQ
ncbi:MAG: hypothetical protein V3T47_05825 [Gammaproteobacteria bacterium]